MEQLYTHLCKTNNIWDPTSPNGCDDAVECSDIIYSSQGTNSSTIKHDVLPLPSSSQIRPGLLQATTSTISSTIVWIHRDRKLRCLNISDSHLHYVLAAFELQTAYAYSRTMFAGISHLPSSQGNTTRGGHETRRSYAFCIHPKITLVWSFSISTGTFSAVVIAYPDQIGHMKSILEDLAVTREHEMGPLLVCLLLFASEIDFDQQRIKAEVREVELRTGFHRWESPKERVPPATGDVTTLSATMSGHAAKLASVTRKLAVSRHVTDFITLYSANSSNNVAQGSSVAGMLSQTSVRPAATPEIFKEHVTLLERRSKMQQTDTEFIDQRVQIQLRAVRSHSFPPSNVFLLHFHSLLVHKTISSSSISSPKTTPCQATRSHSTPSSSRGLTNVTRPR